VLGNLGPNWFASVMGTGIVATAAATLPARVPGLHMFARVVWVFAALLLAVLIVATAAHWVRHPTVARSHAQNPQMAHFYGAAPMALLTVGAGAVLVGKDLIGERVAVDLDWVLWSAGTVGGLAIFAVLFGVPTWGFAVLWIALATALTARTLRRGMPFALTWWSLTFPVGTFVTGTTQLAVHTGLPAFRVAALAAYVGLLGTWILVAVRTTRGGLRGNLFLPPPSTGPIKAQKDSLFM
jgi:tellurite resistance protein TehA-like permease